MIEESLLKSNFIGRDGFRWWIGQIAPTSAWQAQADGRGWGHRYKVRILGYHPYNTSELSDDDLPWAGVLMPTTAGSGGAQKAQSAQIAQGDVVVGFFLDGDDGQIPMIMGSFGKTQYSPSSEYSNPFAPFTGFTKNIEKKEGARDTKESSGQNRDDQKLQRNLDSKQVEQLNAQKKEGEAKEVPASKATGQTVTHADTCDDNFVTEITNILENLIKITSEATNFLGDVQSAIKKIQTLANGFVGNLFSSLYKKLIPLLQKGLKALYDSTFASILASTANPFTAHLAGVAAQQGMVGPVQALQKAMACVAGKIINGLGETIKGLVESTLLEVVNFGVCAAEQFCGSLLNGIIDQITSGLDSALSGVSKILGPAFKLLDFLTGAADILKTVKGFFTCNQTKSASCTGIKEWTIGYGPKNRANVNKALDNALEEANLARLLPKVPGEENSPYTKPDCGTPSSCGGPKVSFFGGNGIGGAGKVIMGGIVNNTEGLSEITSAVTRTGSIIGVEITDPGSGYSYAPPMVTFEDSCGLGYGAVGRTIVDYDQSSPTYGQITGVYIVSEGENYPVEDDEENAVTGAYVLNSGNGYSPGDTATDDNGTEYSLTIDNGRIIAASPINSNIVSDLPKITVNGTGTGALIRPLMGPYNPQKEVVSVIDCVS
jgi:hypothetical protein